MAIIYVAGRSNYLNLFMTNIKFAPHGISSRRFLRSLSLYEIYNFQSFYWIGKVEGLVAKVLEDLSDLNTFLKFCFALIFDFDRFVKSWAKKGYFLGSFGNFFTIESFSESI